MVIGLAERRAQPVERRTLHLVLGAARIDDLAADIADDPDLIELDLAGGGRPSPARLRRNSRNG